MAAKKKAEGRASAVRGNPGIGAHSGDRDAKGRFAPGNKSTGGRKALPEDLKMAFRAACPDALRVLVEIVNKEEAKDSDRIRAAEIILDRGYGKPVQAIRAEDDVPQIGIVLMPPRSDGDA
ncbi:MAG: hypothetical protein J6S60_00220 [Oscillospiraceae bacterium]|nr:hypothetical protein [Oscillospiraceae bacterium]